MGINDHEQVFVVISVFEEDAKCFNINEALKQAGFSAVRPDARQNVPQWVCTCMHTHASISFHIIIPYHRTIDLQQFLDVYPH